MARQIDLPRCYWFGTERHRPTDCLAMTERLSTQYTRTAEGAYLAYQVSGDGPMDVVLPINGNAAIELIWDEPSVSGFVTTGVLSPAHHLRYRGDSAARVDWTPMPFLPLQTWKDDIGTVMDEVRSNGRPLLSWGESGGGGDALRRHRPYPERTTSLVLVNAYARYAQGEDTPWGMRPDLIAGYVTAIQEVWGTGQCAEILAPAMVTTDEARRHWARIERLTASPDVLAAMTRAVLDSDVTPVLPAVQPALVMSRRGDRHVHHEPGRHVADRITGARLSGNSRRRSPPLCRPQ